jgi:hypothetical protein
VLQAGHWQTARRAWAGRTSRFRVVIAKPDRTRTYRVRSERGVSNRRTVVPTTDACGVRPRKPDGSLYTCTLYDGFDGTTLDPGLWVRADRAAAGVSGASCLSPDPRLSWVGGGDLHLSVARTGGDLTCDGPGLGGVRYAAGQVSTYHLFSQQYGRFEARMKVPPVPVAADGSGPPGLQEAFWLWPDARYGPVVSGPLRKEIDIAETYSVKPDLAIPALHYPSRLGTVEEGVSTARDCTVHRGVWNTYTLDWTPEELLISVNGRPCLDATEPAAQFDRPFIIMLSELMGAYDNKYDGRIPLPQTTLVDYVKVWK